MLILSDWEIGLDVFPNKNNEEYLFCCIMLQKKEKDLALLFFPIIYFVCSIMQSLKESLVPVKVTSGLSLKLTGPFIDCFLSCLDCEIFQLVLVFYK